MPYQINLIGKIGYLIGDELKQLRLSPKTILTKQQVRLKQCFVYWSNLLFISSVHSQSRPHSTRAESRIDLTQQELRVDSLFLGFYGFILHITNYFTFPKREKS